MADASFADHRTAALSLLTSCEKLTRRAGSFLGQCVVDASPLSPAQSAWLNTLLERAGLPPMREDVEHG